MHHERLEKLERATAVRRHRRGWQRHQPRLQRRCGVRFEPEEPECILDDLDAHRLQRAIRGAAEVRALERDGREPLQSRQLSSQLAHGATRPRTASVAVGVAERSDATPQAQLAHETSALAHVLALLMSALWLAAHRSELTHRLGEQHSRALT